jgi:membrane-bound lytic murein transglycosylase B
VLAYAAAIVTLALPAVAGPPPRAPIPDRPAALTAAFVRTTNKLHAALARWRGTSQPPPEVTLPALYQQRIERLLSRNEPLGRAVITRVPSQLAAHVRDDVVAHRELARLTPPLRLDSIRIGRSAPAARLRAYYAEAQRRFGVPWSLLAAVNFVESHFGRVRSASAAGAQGPMQFLPSTWRRYGLGGDVHDPHDAILGAANYLHAATAGRCSRRPLPANGGSPARACAEVG